MNTVLPPPTVNDLRPQQRIRLIKSTRKLEAVLGLTPQVVDAATAATLKDHRREGMLFGVSSAEHDDVGPKTPTHKASFSLRLAGLPATPKARHPLPQPLVLRLQSLPASENNNRASIISTISNTSGPRSPLSPTTFATNNQSNHCAATPYAGDFRRRKMAKLARTLGENVPPELVFPNVNLTSDDSSAAVVARKQLRTQRGRSWSVDGTGYAALASSSSLHCTPSLRSNVSNATSADEAMSEWVKTPIAKMAAPLPVPNSVPALTNPAAPFSDWVPIDPANFSNPPSRASSRASSRDDSRPSFDSMSSETSLPTYTLLRSGSRRRKERGWSGEWNQEMDNVINRLRTLKNK